MAKHGRKNRSICIIDLYNLYNLDFIFLTK